MKSNETRRILAVALWMGLCAFPSGFALAQWTEVKGPYFQVITDVNERTGRRFLIEMEQTARLFLNSRFAHADPPRAAVLIIRDRRELEALSITSTRGQVPGAAMRKRLESLIAVLQLRSGFVDEQFFYQTYFHQLMATAEQAVETRCLSEGLAAYFGALRLSGNGVRLVAPYEMEGWIRPSDAPRLRTPVAELLTPSSEPLDAVKAWDCWLMAYYGMTGKRDQLAAYFEEPESWSEIFGDAEFLERDIDDFADINFYAAIVNPEGRRMRMQRPAPPSGEEILVKELSPSEIAAWRAEWYVARGDLQRASERFVEAVERDPTIVNRFGELGMELLAQTVANASAGSGGAETK